MRILSPIVQAFMLAMFHEKAHLRRRRSKDLSLSVIMTRGGVTADFRSLLMSCCAA